MKTIKLIYGYFLKTIFNINTGLYAFYSGTQLKPAHLSWLRDNEKNRDAKFQDLGYSSFKLIDKDKWIYFSKLVDKYFSKYGKSVDSKVDWAINKRQYLEIDKDDEIKELVQQITQSDTFKTNLNSIIGSQKWKITSTMIWRNFPEKFDNPDKEVNSSFFHVDNGGDKTHRTKINVFMYLSEISNQNGPFTYYNKNQSHQINKKFFYYILKYGNLRKYFLTSKVEKFINPNILLDSDGQALAINNQECLHRAGFCKKNTRDIIEFVIN